MSALIGCGPAVVQSDGAARDARLDVADAPVERDGSVDTAADVDAAAVDATAADADAADAAASLDAEVGDGPDAESDSNLAEVGDGGPDGGDARGGACPSPPATSVWAREEGLDVEVQGISALSPTDAWAVATLNGNLGSVYRLIGSTWEVQLRLEGYHGSIRAFSATDVWATLGFTVKHWDGSTWVDRTPPMFDSQVALLVATGPSDVWVMGGDNSSSITHWDGLGWTDRTPVPPGGGRTASYKAMWGSAPDDFWLVGSAGDATSNAALMRHWTGTDWDVPAGPPGIDPLGRSFWSVAGTSAHDVWVSVRASASDELWHFDGKTWLISSPPTGLGSLWTGCPGELWGTGDSFGRVYHLDGVDWRSFALFGNRATTITGSSPIDIWVGGSIISHTNGVVSHRVDDGAAGCGNGRPDPGEACDPPDYLDCSPTCEILPRCGNQRIEAAAHEGCDPPNGTTCSSTCQIVTCGNGKLDAVEVCDPSAPDSPVGVACDASCHITTCGNHVTDTGEQCDPPNMAFGTVWCDQNCQSPTCGNLRVDPGEDCEPPDFSWTPGHGSSKYCGLDCKTHDACQECHQVCDTAPDGFDACQRRTCARSIYLPCG